MGLCEILLDLERDKRSITSTTTFQEPVLLRFHSRKLNFSGFSFVPEVHDQAEANHNDNGDKCQAKAGK
jgi:hypothetical protein